MTSKYLRNRKNVRSFIVILLILYFAGCAAGSCLSYGHSCWGAHGKRNYDGPRILQHRQIEAPKNGRATGDGETIGNPTITNSQNRWFLTNLLKRRSTIPVVTTMVGKQSGNRWHKEHSPVALSGGWDNDYAAISDEIFRNEKAEKENFRDSEDADDNPDLTRKMAKTRDDVTELLVIPSHDEYVNQYPSHTRKLRLYKILTTSSDDNTPQ